MKAEKNLPTSTNTDAGLFRAPLGSHMSGRVTASLGAGVPTLKENMNEAKQKIKCTAVEKVTKHEEDGDGASMHFVHNRCPDSK